MTTATERDIMGEIPEAAREEAERLVTARVMYGLFANSVERYKDERRAQDTEGMTFGEVRQFTKAHRQMIFARNRCEIYCGVLPTRLAGALAVCAKLEAK